MSNRYEDRHGGRQTQTQTETNGDKRTETYASQTDMKKDTDTNRQTDGRTKADGSEVSDRHCDRKQIEGGDRSSVRQI